MSFHWASGPPTCGPGVVRFVDPCRVGLPGSGRPSTDGFVLVALLEGRVVEASYEQGAFVADAEFVERAQLLVALGEQFRVPGSDTVIYAGLSDPLQAALTLMRAADRVVRLDLCLSEVALRYSLPGNEELERGRTGLPRYRENRRSEER